MIDCNKFKQIFDIEDTTERCDRVLKEVQPVVKELVDKYLSVYGVKDSLILDSELHTYDLTLRTTFHDSKNPNYAEQKKSTTIGKKYFVRFEKALDNNVKVPIFVIEFNGITNNIFMGVPIQFIYLFEAAKTNRLKAVLESIDKDVKTMLCEGNDLKEINLEKFHDTIKNMGDNTSKKPDAFIGITLPLEGEIEDSFLLNSMENSWNKTDGIRNYLIEAGTKQIATLNIINLLIQHEEDREITLFENLYTLKYEESDSSSTKKYTQKYGIYKGGQLLVDGTLQFHKYNSYSGHEVLEVWVNGKQMIFTNLRVLLQEEKYEWWIPKSFSTRNVAEGQVELMKVAMKDLQANGIDVKNNGTEGRGNSYYIGAYNNLTKIFDRSISEIKARFIIAGLIFANTLGLIILPKPDNETVPDGEEIDIDNEDSGSVKYKCDFNLVEIMKIFEESNFIFSPSIIRDFHLNLTALSDKHFVILNGISGTGKTQICKLYANAVYGLSYEDENPYLKIIPVRPDWMESSALFGYYSSIEKKYKRTEFLDVVLHALKEREQPHFVVLDEMNLARVEYYLSDYLSAVESRQAISLHNEEGSLEVPKEIIIPPNLYVIGTVNVDETTYSISDKVLDRAFVMTLSDVNFKAFWEDKEDNMKSALEKEFNLLLEIHSILLPLNLHFGYRSMDEMLSKLYANKKLPIDIQMSELEALDSVISEKVLPKIRGDEQLETLLVEIYKWAIDNIGEKSETARHIKRMKGELERYGTAQFWR